MATKAPMHLNSAALLLFCVVLPAVLRGAIQVPASQEVERKDQTEARVTASAGRLTLESDSGDNLEVIDRRAQPEIWYRVTLRAPVGRSLSLICEWIDPNYRVAHRNRYQTKVITKTPWETHARFRLKPDSALGTWKVRLILQGRELRSLDFRVRD